MNGNLLKLMFTPTFIENNLQEIEAFLKETTPFHSRNGALQRQLQAFATHNTCDTLRNIKSSTLIITGDKDLVILPTNSDVIFNQIPDAKLEIIEDAAHGFSYSHADKTAQLIHSFLS